MSDTQITAVSPDQARAGKADKQIMITTAMHAAIALRTVETGETTQREVMEQALCEALKDDQGNIRIPSRIADKMADPLASNA